MNEPEPTLAVVVEAVNNLKEQNDKDHEAMRGFVEAGFSKITDRQDVANHRMSKLEKAHVYIKGIITALIAIPGIVEILHLLLK